MNITESVGNSPAFILLQSTIQVVTLSSSVVQQLRDAVDISDAAKQLAKSVARTHS